MASDSGGAVINPSTSDTRGSGYTTTAAPQTDAVPANAIATVRSMTFKNKHVRQPVVVTQQTNGDPNAVSPVDSTSIDTPDTPDATETPAEVSDEDRLAELHEHPNLVAYLVTLPIAVANSAGANNAPTSTGTGDKPWLRIN